MAFQGDSIFWVEVEKIVPNPFQPRREFDESKLKELSESIRMYGILQPLTVTRQEIQRDDGTFYTEYELIAGERRLRASKLAGLSQVPVIIRSGEQTEQEKLELAIIENLQREDLNAVDRALAFRQLADLFKLSHSQIAAKVGRSREYVSNTLRLLQLPEYMLSSLRLGDISEGHARTLLMLNDRPEEQDTVFREILLKKLSVREVERITRKIATDKVRKRNWQHSDPTLIEIEKQFTETLGTRVQIMKTDYGGKLTIDYFSPEDLNKILLLVKQETIQGGGRLATAAILEEISESEASTDEIINVLIENTPLQIADTIDTPSVTETNETVVNNEDVVTNDSVTTPEVASVVSEATEAPVETESQNIAPEVPVESEPQNESPELSPDPEPQREADDNELYDLKNFGI